MNELVRRVTDLLNRYEYPEDEWLMPEDVQDELRDILDESEFCDLWAELDREVNEFQVRRWNSSRYGGREPDGGDEFIENVERLVDYES